MESPDETMWRLRRCSTQLCLTDWLVELRVRPDQVSESAVKLLSELLATCDEQLKMVRRAKQSSKTSSPATPADETYVP